MALCCCFFVSLKIHSSGLVIRAVSKGRERWALEKAWVVLGRAPVCWHGGVEGQGAVGGQAPTVSGHQGFVPLAQQWHVKGQGCLGFSWTLLQPEQSREASGPSRVAKGTGAASGLTHRLLPPGMPSSTAGLQSAATSRELLALPAERQPGCSTPWPPSPTGFYHHEHGAKCHRPAWASWSLQRLLPRVWQIPGLAWAIWQSGSETAPGSQSCLGDQRDMTKGYFHFCLFKFLLQ